MYAGDWKVDRSRSMTPAGRQAYYQLKKSEVFEALGNECQECKHKDTRVLQIDHVESGGSSDRKKYSGTSYLTYVLKNLASGRFQLLCANCNWIKRHTHNEVPRIYPEGHIFPASTDILEPVD